MKIIDIVDCKKMLTPTHPTCSLVKEETTNKVGTKVYRDMIRSLIYLVVSRFGILFSDCLCVRFFNMHLSVQEILSTCKLMFLHQVKALDQVTTLDMKSKFSTIGQSYELVLHITLSMLEAQYLDDLCVIDKGKVLHKIKVN